MTGYFPGSDVIFFTKIQCYYTKFMQEQGRSGADFWNLLWLLVINMGYIDTAGCLLTDLTYTS